MTALMTVFTMILVVFVSPVVAQAPLQFAILDFPPYEFSEHDRIDGITVRIVREVFQRMEQPISLRLLPWSRALLYLKSGKIHGVFEVLHKREREEFVDYSREVLMQETTSLFILEGKNITFDGTMHTLKNYRIGVRQDFSYGSKFDEAVKNKTLKHVITEVYPANLLRLLNIGKIDVLIGDRFGIPYTYQRLKHLREKKTIVRLSPDVQDTPSYMVFSKKHSLLSIRDRFDQTLRQMKQEGSYQKILADWEHNNRLQD